MAPLLPPKQLTPLTAALAVKAIVGWVKNVLPLVEQPLASVTTTLNKPVPTPIKS